MFYKIFFLTFFLANTCLLTAQTLESDIAGKWSLADGDHSFIEFEKTENGDWKGIITETDVARSIGKLLFDEGVYNAEKDAIEGVLIHPDSGWKVNGKVTLDSPQRLKVVASKLFISKTFYWPR